MSHRHSIVLWAVIYLLAGCHTGPVPVAPRTGTAAPTPSTNAARAARDAEDARVLIALEHSWVASYVSADADFLEQLFRDDVVLVNSRGEVSTKRTEVDEVRTG